MASFMIRPDRFAWWKHTNRTLRPLRAKGSGRDRGDLRTARAERFYIAFNNWQRLGAEQV
jgi:hypothetical protein